MIRLTILEGETLLVNPSAIQSVRRIHASEQVPERTRLMHSGGMCDLVVEHPIAIVDLIDQAKEAEA